MERYLAAAVKHGLTIDDAIPGAGRDGDFQLPIALADCLNVFMEYAPTSESPPGKPSRLTPT